MDYVGYDPRGRIMPALPVATISTGVSLTERFKHYQQSHVERRQVGAGYGLPPQQQNPMYGQRRPYNAPPIPSLIPNPAISARNRQLALALAKRAMNPPVQNKRRLSVQSRLGVPPNNLRQRGLAAGIPNRLGSRRGVTRNSIPGRGQGLKQIQRSPGLINRLGNRGKFRGGGGINQRGQMVQGQQRGRRIARGNTRNRGGGGGGKPGNTKEVKPSKEALDTELDSYMSHSKAYLDKQLDDYMQKRAQEALAQAQAGIVTDDVTMAEIEPTS